MTQLDKKNSSLGICESILKDFRDFESTDFWIQIRLKKYKSSIKNFRKINIQDSRRFFKILSLKIRTLLIYGDIFKKNLDAIISIIIA